MSFLRERWTFDRVPKKYWPPPAIVTTLALGALIALGHGSAIAPMICTVF